MALQTTPALPGLTETHAFWEEDRLFHLGKGNRRNLPEDWAGQCFQSVPGWENKLSSCPVFSSSVFLTVRGGR